MVGGHDLSREHHIRAISGLVVSDERSFFWRLSAWQNLSFFAALHGYYGRRAAVRIEAVLNAVNLRDRARDPFNTLSAGMRQRLAIARALLHEPQVLFLDEPTTNLDPLATQDLHQLIRDLQSGGQLTILLITHDLEEAEKLCERIALMANGRVRLVGQPSELRRQLDPKRRYAIDADELDAPIREALGGLLGDTAVQVTAGLPGRQILEFQLSDETADLTSVLDILRDHSVHIYSVEGAPPTLEEVFARYTSPES
jgi:ABC-2 type transport system ATP-binding protein